MTDLNELLKQTSRSLYLSAHFLPRTVRACFAIGYLLCRYADSIADTALLTPNKRLYWIEEFPSLILHPDTQKQQDLVREISGSSSNIYEEKLLQNLSACQEAFDQLPDVQKKMILEVVRAVCQGMKLDLQTFPPERTYQIIALPDNETLETYCHLMGGEPGVFWSRLIVSHAEISMPNKKFLALGKEIGDALQIVNILRDLPRDLRIGRCYIPSEDLQKYGLKPEDLLEQINSPRFEPVKKWWINWGRKKLQAAHAYFAALPKMQPRHRAAVAWPVLWAADTLNKLEQETNLLDSGHKVKIPRSRIYLTMFATPLLCLSNGIFSFWLRRKLHAKRGRSRTQKK